MAEAPPPPPAPGRWVGLVVDLMDRSKLRGVRFVRRPEDLVGAPEPCVLVDLALPGAVEVLARLGARERVVAYGSHVDRTVLDAAAAAGAEALPRSRVLPRWPDV